MSYIGNTPGVSSQRVVLEQVISGSAQSAFTPVSGYTLGYVDVLVNGVEIDSNEFTASDGVTVTLANAAQVGDTVKIKTWLPRGLSDGYLKSEADARFLKLDGSNYLTGSLGVGVAPAAPVHIQTSAQEQLRLGRTTTGSSGYITFFANNSSSAQVQYAGILGDVASSTAGSHGGNLLFYTTGSGTSAERARIDSSGNFLLGTTSGNGLKLDFSPSTSQQNGITYTNSSPYTYTDIYGCGTSGTWQGLIRFFTSNNAAASERARFDSNGVLLIGTTARANAPDHSSVKLAVNGELHLQSQGSHIWFGDSTNAAPIGIGEGLVNTVGTDQDFLSVYYRSSLRFFAGTTESARFDASSNLLMLNASTPSGNGHIALQSINGSSNVIATGNRLCAYVNDGNGGRWGGVGVIMTPGTGGGTTSGAGIGFYTSSNTYSGYSQTYNNSLSWFIYGYGNLVPYNDNNVSLGESSKRTSVIYSVTGTINTSDRAEKQDIRDLSDAEKLVAQEIKTLFKAFRWKDAVAQKGDDARIHVSVIAQDVQNAFAKHGLDASRYALWCSDTWYEVDGFSIQWKEGGEVPDGAVVKTRLGIRYDQLLAFVIAAM